MTNEMHKSVLYGVRHLAARDQIFPGEELVLPDLGPVLVEKGVHPDGEAHLQAAEYLKAEELGQKFHLPNEIGSFLIAPSPLPRTVEAARHLFVGMARGYARDIGIDLSDPQQKDLRVRGLHTAASFSVCRGIEETSYKDARGRPDHGNELVGEAFSTTDSEMRGYKYIVEQGFQNDPRTEHPQKIADRGLAELIPELVRNDVILATTHQPNMEILTAAVSGSIGSNASELWERVGGSYRLGGGFMLTATFDPSARIFTSALLLRTTADAQVPDFSIEIPLNLDILNHFLRVDQQKSEDRHP